MSSIYFKIKQQTSVLICILCLSLGMTLFTLLGFRDIICCNVFIKIFNGFNTFTCLGCLFYLYKLSGITFKDKLISFTYKFKWLKNSIMISFSIALLLLLKISWFKPEPSFSNENMFIKKKEVTHIYKDTIVNPNDSLLFIQFKELIKLIRSGEKDCCTNNPSIVNKSKTYITNESKYINETNLDYNQLINKIDSIQILLNKRKDSVPKQTIQIINNNKLKIKKNKVPLIIT